MSAAIRSEFRKFFSTRLWWVLAIVMMAYCLLFSSSMGWMFGYMAANDDLTSLDSLRPAVYNLGPVMGYLFPAIIGAVSVTAEYRHNTIVPTFLGEPRRSVTMVAKVIAAIPMGLIIGILGTAACLLGGGLGFTGSHAGAALGAAATWEGAGLSVLAMTIWALVGVGLGMLIISQVGVIIALLVFTQLIEPVIRTALGLKYLASANWIAKFLPGAASEAASGGHSVYSLMGIGSVAHPLLAWQGALVLAAYGIIFGLIGYFARIRRDVS